MPDKTETIVIIIIFIIIFFCIILPLLLDPGTCGCHNAKENFITHKSLENINHDANNVVTKDQINNNNNNKTIEPIKNNYESLIYDNITGTVMTNTQFMENTGIIAPPWIAPAWKPDALGPSSKDKLDPADYENDPRMLYNKCSLSCCSPQYPTPFQADKDPLVYDKDGNKKYLSSDYICQNNAGGTGCLCMSEKQVEGLRTGFINYYVDKENLGY